MGMEQAEKAVKARHDYGHLVLTIRLDLTGNMFRNVLAGMNLILNMSEVSVGRLVWEIANFAASWGHQDRLGYAPERPVHRVREFHFRRFMFTNDAWEAHFLGPDDGEKVKLYLASSNRW